MDIKKVSAKAIDIFNDWKPSIIKGLKLTAGVLVAAMAKSGLEKVGINLDVPASTSKGSSSLLYFSQTCPYKTFEPETITEKKMYSIYNRAMSDKDEWWKLQDTKDIFELAKTTSLENERNFATDLITEIAGSITDRFYANRINDILMKM